MAFVLAVKMHAPLVETDFGGADFLMRITLLLSNYFLCNYRELLNKLLRVFWYITFSIWISFNNKLLNSPFTLFKVMLRGENTLKALMEKVCTLSIYTVVLFALFVLGGPIWISVE